jgi:hypothetical protein
MAGHYTIEQKVVRALARGGLALLAVALLAYPADWAVWRLRVAAGGGMGQVKVSRFTVAELKGNKETYYFDGTEMSDCSRSLFPEAGSGACWWVARHPEEIVRY